MADAPPVVAIDGPSGVGKSTAARNLARRLGAPYLDTGAMYRAVALACLERGIDPADTAGVGELAAGLDLRLEPAEDGGARVVLDGAPVGERIRTPEVSETSSRVSAVPAVRARLVELQRAYARRHGGVVEGRDIGTRVFPDTPYKFFLDARSEIRHRRRWEELRRAGREVTLEEVAADQERRDRRDAGRDVSPLTCDETYTRIDTSELDPEAVVDAMAAAIAGLGG